MGWRGGARQGKRAEKESLRCRHSLSGDCVCVRGCVRVCVRACVCVCVCAHVQGNIPKTVSTLSYMDFLKDIHADRAREKVRGEHCKLV